MLINRQICECPCRKCGDRSEGCHSECSKYIGWKETNERYRHIERINNVKASTGWNYYKGRSRKHE